jgi:hypothetical protein
LAPALVISQVAFSLLLLIGAGLFVRSLENLRNVDAGFHHEGVLLIDLDPRRAGYKEVRLAALYQEILARLMGGATVEVLASGSLAQVSASVRQAIQARLPDAQMVVQTFTAQVNRPLIQERLLATLASFFGVLALG